SLRELVLRTNEPLPFGLAVRTRDGHVTTIGDAAPSFELRIENDAGMKALRSLSELEICEAYIRGDIDFEGDLVRAMEFRQILTDRQPLIRLWAHLQPLLFGRKRCNPEWIAQHYDSNNIQLLALDADYNTYTPGIYEDGDTLERGAARKLEYAWNSL